MELFKNYAFQITECKSLVCLPPFADLQQGHPKPVAYFSPGVSVGIAGAFYLPQRLTLGTQESVENGACLIGTAAIQCRKQLYAGTVAKFLAHFQQRRCCLPAF